MGRVLAADRHRVPAGAPTPADVPASSEDRAGAATAPGVAPAQGEQAVTLALVHRAQAGDVRAFGELYDRYVELVYRYIHYRVGSVPLAEDLTSETFLRALRRITSFTWQGRDIGAWFVTIARNLVGASGAKLVTDGPEGAVLQGMQNAVLLAAVKQLGSEQQECIVLRFLHGFSVAETAQAMDRNVGAVKALQYRAIRSLGRLLPEGVEL